MAATARRRGRARRPTARRALALVGCALVLAGCELDAEVGVTVDRDGAGELAVRLVADAELAERAAAAGVDPFATLVDSAAGLDGWDVEADDLADGGAVATVTGAFDDPDELAALSNDLAGALDAPEMRALEEFAVDLADDTVTVTGGAGLVPTSTVAELGLDPASATALLDEAVGYRVTVTMPGAVLETNADVAEGNRATWTVAAGEQVDLRVVAERPPPWWLWPAIGGAAALVLLLVAVVVWRWRRGRRARGAHAA